MSAGIIVNESPSAFREFTSFGFAFYRGGTCGCGDQIRKIRFGNRAFETGEVATDQGDYFLGGELVPEAYSPRPRQRCKVIRQDDQFGGVEAVTKSDEPSVARTRNRSVELSEETESGHKAGIERVLCVISGFAVT